MNTRLQELTALMMIGDGVLAVARPREHCLIWLRGPEKWEHLVEWFADRPKLTRALGIAEAAFGLWWASQLRPQTAEAPIKAELARRGQKNLRSHD
jgi:hypothetical protein